MRICNVAIAGLGGVGRTTARLLLERRGRYRQVHGADVRLVVVCGSQSGLHDAAGLSMDRLAALKAGLSGPDFLAESGADVSIEAGPSDFRTGASGLAYIRSALTMGRDTIVISKRTLGRVDICGGCGFQRGPDDVQALK